jgi:hypothetical protein
MPEYFKGLVQPNDAELTLNGYKLKQNRKVDAEKQHNAYFATVRGTRNIFKIIVFYQL